MTQNHPTPLREPLTEGVLDLAQVSRDVCGPLDAAPSRAWYAAFAAALGALGLGALMVTHQLLTGIGTWGLNKTVGWSFDITNFVFWIGIGHAGTLISAILFLFRQKWRTSINRSAEAMTLFAVMVAGLFPLIHMGRPWLAYWVMPYPNPMGPLWVNFRSPLLWDVFAISTYLTISAVFWFLGLLPDLATLRDRTPDGLRKKIYALASLGWDGSHRTWQHYEKAYLLLAGLATPLVLSVHTIVSFDFATSLVPGWHTTIFPPYFVAGAIFSGFAMVLTLLLIARKVMKFEGYITLGHIDSMCKVVLLTSGLMAAAYSTELLMSYYSASYFERFASVNRLMGPYAGFYWAMIFCNVVVPQLLWSRRLRRNVTVVFALSLFINVGMWLERFVIITVSLHRDYLPSSWVHYAPTYVEIGTLIGSFGLFFTLFLLFCRFLPMIAISEVKGVLKKGKEDAYAA